MAHGRIIAAALSALALGACSAPEAGEPVAAEQAPIVGGIHDVFRSYVVGVGKPYNPADPDDPSAGPRCSGTLVSRRTVITAGHCYASDAGALGGLTAVFFGPDITSPLPPAATVVATVRAVVHPGFDATTLSNDLAMLELAADAPSQAVPLLRETMANTPEFIGPRFAFAGYGDDSNGDHGIRRVVTFPISRVGPACVGPTDATQLYHGVAGKKTCTGDPGGPVLLPRGAVERLAGAISTGGALCVEDGHDARTDAPQIAAFIQPTLDLFEGADPCRADGVCDESCNGGHQLGDPDCAPAHCGADGICVLSCVEAPDPDCAPVDHCGPDGVCDPSCSSDPDCQPTPEAVPDAGVPAESDSCGSGGAGGGQDAGVVGVEDPLDCGCRAAGRGEGGGSRMFLLLALGAILVVRRYT